MKTAAGLQASWRRWHLSLDLLLGRRLLLFGILDAIVVLRGLSMALLEGYEPREIYAGLVTFPFVILALPAMADVIALERRAGSLDLALATTSTEAYFVRRVLTVCGLLAAQGMLFILLTPLAVKRVFPIPLALANTMLIAALSGAIVLFWAVRLKSFGGVWMASLGTMVALGKWTFRNPIPKTYETKTGWLLPDWEELVGWSWNALILAVAITLFAAYARRRLRRPEAMLR